MTHNNQLIESITSHVVNLISLNREIAEINEKYQKLHAELISTQNRKSELMKEFKDARKILDFCIDTNSDPVQVKLSHTTVQIDLILQQLSLSNQNNTDNMFDIDP